MQRLRQQAVARFGGARAADFGLQRKLQQYAMHVVDEPGLVRGEDARGVQHVKSAACERGRTVAEVIVDRQAEHDGEGHG